MGLRLLAAAILLSYAIPAAAQAAQSDATVDVRPDTIAVAPWDRAVEAKVILFNTGEATISGATVSMFSNDGIAAAVDPTPGPAIGPRDSFAWHVAIDLGNARVPGSLELDIAYRVGNAARARHVYRAIKIAAADGAVTDKPVEARLSGSFDTVNETRPGRGYLIIDNNLDVPVTIAGIRIDTPDPASFDDTPDFDVSTNQSPAFTPFDVPPRSSRSQFVGLGAARSVTSGKHHVVFAIDAEWTRHGRRQSRTILVGQDVTLGVFFESELLKALGVPSFLVLPGCMFLFAIQLLLKFEVGGTNRPAKFNDLAPTSSSFWIIAITWSGIFAVLYFFVTGTDYLSRYGARDLRNVWLSSIALGMVFYWILVLRNQSRNRNRPGDKDSPATTLIKMGNRGLPMRIDKADFTLNNAALSAFIIDEPDPDTIWVAPAIQLTWNGDAATLPEKQKIVDLANAGTAAELARAVAAQPAMVALEWNAAGSVHGPTPIPRKDVTRGAKEPMVSVV